MKIINTLGGLAAAGLALAVLPAGAAMAADTGDTDVTFSLTGGSLDITVQADAALSNGSPGFTSVSGSLGAVAVTDTRGSTAGWVMSAASSQFVTAGAASTGVSYDSGVVTASSGTVTPTTGGVTDVTDDAAPVAAGEDASGNNSASYTPTLTVALPASALAGDYEGTVTTSVL